MKCPYCNKFKGKHLKGNNIMPPYSVREQLLDHIESKHSTSKLKQEGLGDVDGGWSQEQKMMGGVNKWLIVYCVTISNKNVTQTQRITTSRVTFGNQ